jgi:NMD protein affecting ribosome stability and mRNA decay
MNKRLICPECGCTDKKCFTHLDTETVYLKNGSRLSKSGRKIYQCNKCGTIFTQDGWYEDKVEREVEMREDFLALEEGFDLINSDRDWSFIEDNHEI